MVRRGRYGYNKRVVVVQDFERVVAGAAAFICPHCESLTGQMRDYNGRHYYTCCECKRRVLGTAYEPRCYDSEWEAKRGEALHRLQAGGHIVGLVEHPKIKLPYCPRGWIPDFVYSEAIDGEFRNVIEDVKGPISPQYILKRRIIVGEKGPAAVGCLYRESWYERGELKTKDYAPSPERLVGVTADEVAAACEAIEAYEQWDEDENERTPFWHGLESLLAKLLAVSAGEERA